MNIKQNVMSADGAAENYLGPDGLHTRHGDKIRFTSSRSQAVLEVSYTDDNKSVELNVPCQRLRYKELSDLIEVLKEVKTDWKSHRDNRKHSDGF